MPDITMCQDSQCKERSDCYRYRAVPTCGIRPDGEVVGLQSFFTSSPRPKRGKCPLWMQSTHIPSERMRTTEQADKENDESSYPHEL